MKELVSVSRLVKKYDDVRVLDSLSLNIGPGVFGLIGPNGAGKTTLLRTLLGLTHADAGKAEVLGLDCEKDSIHIRERVGVLHERPTYPRGLTPLRFLQRVRDLYGKGQDPKTLLGIVGLSSSMDRKIANLSAGMTQRLGVAQALISQPELVLLDEPTSNLDVVGREEMTRLILDLHSDFGMSFVVASHVLSELERICDNVAFIRNGVVLEQGKTLDLISRHAAGRFRVTTERPQQLASVLEKVPGVRNVKVTGMSALVLTSDLAALDDLQREVRDAALCLGIRIHAIYEASTLEDTYMEVMTGGL